MKWCIDPGHGGKDSGAVGPTGLNEAPTVLSISNLLTSELGKLGHHVLQTRYDDIFVELSDRCDIANDWKADYFISVHCNSNGPTAVGIETLYASEKGKALAIPIQKHLVAYTLDVDRGVKHRSNLYVLNGTYMPAVLVEVGFISHPETEKSLKVVNYQFTLAAAIVAGVNEFLGVPPPSSSLPPMK